MRTTIRRRIIDAVPSVQVLQPDDEIDYAASRVFEPHGATESTEFPFIVFGEGERDPSEAPSAMSTLFEAYPYIDRTTFRDLDTIVGQIKAAFDWQLFEHDGRPLLSELLPAGEDVLDAKWGDRASLTKPVRFEVSDLSMFVTETYSPDPVEGLRSWAEMRWPEVGDPPEAQIQTDPTTWLPSDAQPGIFFRFQGIPQLLEQTAAVSWFRGQLRAHVIAPSRSERLQWTRRLTEALAIARQVRLDDGSFFYLESISADTSMHAIREGQIGVQGRYGVLVPAPEADTLENINLEEQPAP